ncbi:MAG: ion transporter [Pseudomonadales bacterium]|jgi:voltage-gated potassium channel|uniref:potassium channel family protein n=1 Tax=unclassified Ketobacter TaxID=2639109 RepID=UPI000C4258A3|nr:MULTISPECIES: potassium channel family protein [unclassified Ketobacter]MAQ24941.1 ion transporter [Pseudomonadales bacterium]MEC8810596.1 potassium channel family protein [Pseudomonadota bacterium]TNC89189.1 MAG: ion transporter [Alcanivorax sp.]HAG94122.1 ion transporter [Gammaproteobacteria bacterium]MBI26791.1 ion transporter [Pseudomonadales bacterium]|tara:strand:- start:14139 stop:14942 length:804 start_codon:yes stop_codon:yes gene_type:complete
MQKHTIDVFMGFGGVHPAENEKAVRWGGYLEAPMLIIALWILLDWYLISNGLLEASARITFDWIVWSFFLIETSLLTLLCTNRLRHLTRNWANLAIIILAFPPLFEVNEQFGLLRLIRLFFLVGFFSHNLRLVMNVLTQNHLGKTLVISAVFITGSGILIAGIDPAIHSPAEGIWWAWVTVTTVGYGDVVPASTEGRIFASLLILMGICLVSLITANVSAYLLSKSSQKELRYEQRQLRKLLDMEERIEGLEKKIDSILEALNKKKN